MKDSESKPVESVEQHDQPPNNPTLLKCPICGAVGLPERIADHNCNTPLVAHVHLRIVDPLLSSSTNSTQDDTPQPTRQPQTEPIALEQLTIEWTPSHGPTREVTFEHTDTGWHRIEATQTDTDWQTTSVEPAHPPTLELITPLEEDHSHE